MALQDFQNFTGTTASFDLPHDGIYQFTYQSFADASLFLEGYFVLGPFAGAPPDWGAIRTLDGMSRKGTITAVLSAGTFRLNNIAPGSPASVTIDVAR
jgi:hypothetical protein